MSVIGFDFGNLSCYTACARGGGIETLANEYSARMTPSYVSFTGNQRLMGTASQQAQVTNLKNTFYNLKRFIGRFFNDPRVLYEKEHFSPLQMVEGPDNSILFQVSNMTIKLKWHCLINVF
jgi:molecular chaperone DnaK (HSP70)